MPSTWYLPTIMLWSLAITLTFSFTSINGEAPNDIYRFFPDHTIWIRRFACTEQESDCFKEKKLLYEEDGQCYAVKEQGPCASGRIFHVDKAEAERRGGHLRGTCRKQCPGEDYAPLAATGECMSRTEVQEKICRPEWYLRPVYDVFGQWVCEWTVLVCSPSELFDIGHISLISDSDFFNGVCYPPGIYSTSYEKVPANRPPDHPLLRYVSNHTALNREFRCTREEEACLRYGRLLDVDGNCYKLEERPPRCGFSQIHLDWDEAMKPEGKLQGTCDISCVSYEESKTRRDRCVDFSIISAQVCRREWGMQTIRDVFGQTTCGCIPPRKQSSIPSSVSPPASTPGYCRIPDFLNPVQKFRFDESLGLGFEVPCSEEEFTCLKRGAVFVEGQCFPLHTKGPCAENEQLVLDKEALAHAQLKPKCQGPCPAGTLLMPVDGSCFTYAEMKSLICPLQEIALDEFGGWRCSYVSDPPANLTTIFRHPLNGTCVLPGDSNVIGGGFIGGGTFNVGGGVGR